MEGKSIVLGDTLVAPRRNRLEVTYGGAVLEHVAGISETVCFLDRDMTIAIQRSWGTHRPALRGTVLVLEPRE